VVDKTARSRFEGPRHTATGAVTETNGSG